MALPDPPFYYSAFRAWDVLNDTEVADAPIQWFAEGDSSFATPLEVWDTAGVSQGVTLTSTGSGDVGEYVLAVPFAVAKSGSWTTPVQSTRGLREHAEATLAAAEAAQDAAEAAWAAVDGGSGGGGSGSGNMVAQVFSGGAYPAQPATYPAGTIRVAIGPTPANFAETDGVVLDMYIPMDLA